MTRSSGWLRGFVATETWGEVAADNLPSFEELVAIAKTFATVSPSELNELNLLGRLENGFQTDTIH
jgi:hypothetical protein